MFDRIKLFLKGNILEIVSGIGNISAVCVQQGVALNVSDMIENYLSILRQRFLGQPLVKKIFRVDLADENFESNCTSLLGTFDTVFALNVVEHIANDKLAIANGAKLLKKDGHIIILVPAYNALYNGIDEGLEHFRRYNRKSLNGLLADDFDVIKTSYFNLAGMVGWFVTGNVMGKKTLLEELVKLYNRMVPLFRVADAVTFNQMGLSVIAVGKKKA